MGQKEVYEFLKLNIGVPFTCQQISDQMEITFSSASSILKKLAVDDEIRVERVVSEKGHDLKRYSFIPKDSLDKEIDDDLMRARINNMYEREDVRYLRLILKELKRRA